MKAVYLAEGGFRKLITQIVRILNNLHLLHPWALDMPLNSAEVPMTAISMCTYTAVLTYSVLFTFGNNAH